MRVICSSVIRSVNKIGASHGGLYVIDYEKETVEQVLDWNYPYIRWDSGGGDRGLRGMIFYGDYLYTSGATHIYVFNKKFELVDKYEHPCFDGTHEMCLINDNLIVISNCFDAILSFNLTNKKWNGGFQHVLGKNPIVFKADEDIQHSDTLHLDTVSFKDGFIWYAGSTTEYLYGFNPFTQETKQIKLYYPNTHNAQFWKDGIVFNRSLESDTCYQVGDQLIYRWPTPKINRDLLRNQIVGDHARTEYTRGMAIDGDMIAIGTSPATVHFFNLTSSEPQKSFIITTDIRNSICGMQLYPW